MEAFQVCYIISNKLTKKQELKRKAATVLNPATTNILTKRPDIRFAAVLVKMEHFRRGPLDWELSSRGTDVFIIQNVPAIMRVKHTVLIVTKI